MGQKQFSLLHIWLQVSDDHVKLPKTSQNQIWQALSHAADLHRTLFALKGVRHLISPRWLEEM